MNVPSSLPHSPSAPDQAGASRPDAAIESERLRHLCEVAPWSVMMSTSLALVLCFTLTDSVPRQALLAWCGLFLVAQLTRMYFVLRADSSRPDIWASPLRLGMLLTGLSWGAASMMIYPVGSVEHQLYLAICLAGLTAAATMTSIYDMPGSVMFIASAVIPFVIRSAFEPTALSSSMAITAFLFLAFSMLAIRYINQEYQSNLQLRMKALEAEAKNREFASKLEVSVQRFQSLTQLSSDWYWEQDSELRFTEFYGAHAEEFGITDTTHIGKSQWEIGAINMSDEDWKSHQAVLEARLPFYDLELCRLDKNGDVFWASVSGHPILDGRGNFSGYRGVGRVITERKRAEDETQRMAYYDMLTGLPNRRFLMSSLPQSLSSSRRNRKHGALMFIDLDDFKKINDTLGHQHGDELLQQVARRLTSGVRDTDTVARLGGDEFVIVLESLHESQDAATRQAESLAHKLLGRLNQPFLLNGSPLDAGASIGISLFGVDENENVDALLKQADAAMYQSKRAGRNRVRIFDPQHQMAVDALQRMENELPAAMRDNQFILHYQPQVNRDSRVIGAEALIRWNHPRRGILSPGEFISIAESSEFIIELGAWVLETACRQLAQWRLRPETEHLTIAINVSAKEIIQPNFVETVVRILDESGADPTRLKLEITESQLLENVALATEAMTRLKAVGVGFALDDFGTGYSSLYYLKKLPLDQLKIDQSFVRDVHLDSGDATIAKTIISLGRNMGLDVIAEGVETTEQLEFLVQEGCSGYQGYLFGRPGLAKEIEITLIPAFA